MIRRQNRKTPARPSLPTLALVLFLLSPIHGRAESLFGTVQKDSISTINDGLLQLEKDLADLKKIKEKEEKIKEKEEKMKEKEEKMKKERKTAFRQPAAAIPSVIEKTTPPPLSDTSQSKNISSLSEELIIIEKELLRLGREQERKASVQKPPATIPPAIEKTTPPTPSGSSQSKNISSLSEELIIIEKELTEIKRGEESRKLKRVPSTARITPESRSVVIVRPSGHYFLLLNSGIAFAQDREFASSYASLLRTRPGVELSVAFGRQFGPWTIGPEIGYRRLEYKQFIVQGLPTSSFSSIDATGNSSSYSLAMYVGRDFQLGHSWHLHSGVSLGVSESDEFLSVQVSPTSSAPTFTGRRVYADGSHFQGSIRTALQYSFSDLFAAYLGYRFTYVDDLEDFEVKFDSLLVHQAELGLRWNL
ncbi:MAG: hypothetical protein O3A82_16025 [Verrucomicrobia bacterium]|nr:hypothetical protein [Verrucomicrobiota bacterium]